MALVGDGRIVVRTTRRVVRGLLEQLGWSQGDAGGWVLRYGDEESLAATLSRLRDFGVPMTGGAHGWPPAEVFADLRERGLVSGDFLEITWTAPGRAQSRLR